MEKYFKRFIDEKLKTYLKTFGAVSIEDQDDVEKPLQLIIMQKVVFSLTTL